MRKLVLALVAVVGAAAILTFVPAARQRFEAISGISLPGGVAGGQAESKKKGGPQAVPVSVANVVAADMPVVLSAAGTVEALASVAVRTRVDGQIVSLGFVEGDLVQEGQVLFQFDDRLAKAQIAQAEANIAKDRASLADAEGVLSRRETLIQKKITSEASLDTARATVNALKASIAAGQAALDVQKTQLDYLTIRAPITARTGSLSAKAGTNVRAADTTPLVTLNQVKPIAVAFAMPQTDLMALRDALKRGAKADVLVLGSKPARVIGDLTFVDNQVDKTTGTVTAKVIAKNDEEVLWPGLAVQVDLTVETKPGMPSAPASAVLPAQDGMIAWVVGADNKVAPRSVTLERIVGQTAFVSSGLKPGDRVVIDGQLRLAAGTTVTIGPAKPAGGDKVPAAGSKGVPEAGASTTKSPASGRS